MFVNGPIRLAGWQVLLSALLLHAAAFALIAHIIPIVEGLSTIHPYFEVGKQVQAGQVPYRDFIFEYPPLAIPLFWLPVLFVADVDGYRTAFMLQMLAFNMLGVVVTLWALRRFQLDNRAWFVVLLQPVLLVAAGRDILFERFDLAPAVVVLLALVCFGSGRVRTGWLTLGIGTALKLYPLILAPLFAIEQLQHRQWRALAEGMLLFAAVLVVPSLLVTHGELIALRTFVEYHVERGLEIETLYASILLLLRFAGDSGMALGHVEGHHSEELLSPLAPFFSTLAFPLTLAALLTIYGLYGRVLRHAEGERGRFDVLVQFSSLAILAFMLLGKVLSPQYLLWLYPLFGVLSISPLLVWSVLGAALLVTRWIFPEHWLELLDLQVLPIKWLILRNVLLVAFGVLLCLPRRLFDRAAHRELMLPLATEPNP
ncbi:MAG: DUF2029 domain-containing protein [Chloroflexi bacterium]|nr:DUF2029 domain-containing protein [Chloroflexota bacterium]